MVQRPYPDAYLLGYSEDHVAYEVRMFFEMVAALSTPAPSASSSISYASTTTSSTVGMPNSITPPPTGGYHVAAQNAMVESFMAHSRNLIEFLYSDLPRPTDVVASDFFLAGTWKQLRPPLSTALSDARKRADKELAHLTTSRIFGNPPDKQWNVTALAAELKPVLRIFVDNANSSALSPKVKAAIPIGDYRAT
jgi:hypothetical protein